MSRQPDPHVAEAPTTALLSWAHRPDDGITADDWESKVLDLVVLLRANGVDVELDLFRKTERGMDWGRWGSRMVSDQDFVLIAVNCAWRQRWEGRNHRTEGAGAVTEANALRGLFEEDQEKFQRKALVVRLPGIDASGIPTDLRHLQRFELQSLDPAGIEDLLRLLTGQPEYVPNKVGPIPLLPTRTREHIHSIAEEAADGATLPALTATGTASVEDREVGLSLLYAVRRRVTSLTAGARWTNHASTASDTTETDAALQELAADIDALSTSIDRDRRQNRARTQAVLDTCRIGLHPDHAWCLISVVVANRPPQRIEATESQDRLTSWSERSGPMLPLAINSLTQREVHRVVHTGEPYGPINTVPHSAVSRRWRIEAFDDGSLVAAFALAPDGHDDSQNIALPRDMIEIAVMTALDLAATVCLEDDTGLMSVRVDLIGPQTARSMHLVDSARHPDHADEPPARVPCGRDIPVDTQPSSCLDVSGERFREPASWARLARELILNVFDHFGVEQANMIGRDGSVEPRRAGVRHQQQVHQFATRHGLPVDPISPAQRQADARELRERAAEILQPPAENWQDSTQPWR